MTLNVVNGPEHWDRRAAENRHEWSVSEARVREIIREEIAWALQIAGKPSQAAAPAPVVKAGRITRGPNRVSDAKAAMFRAIADDYRTGISLLETANRHKVSVASVTTALRYCGETPRRRGCPYKPAKADARLPDFIQMRERGATLDEIGARYQITRERVRQILNKAGVETHERPLTPEQRLAVEEYHAGSESLDFFAARCGVSTAAFRKWVTRCGYVPRRKGNRLTDRVKVRAAKVAELYNAGVIVSDIAKRLGFKYPEAVYRDLARSGVKPSRNVLQGRV